MIKSIYTPLSGALAQEKVLETIANNLANISTVGFKGEKVSFELLEPEGNSKSSENFIQNNYYIFNISKISIMFTCII